jgi:hypothetical protein
MTFPKGPMSGRGFGSATGGQESHRPTHDRPALLAAGDLGLSLTDEGEIVPTVIVDAADHPEVADLARVHSIEGVGDLRTTARRVTTPTGDLLLLGVSLTVPVQAAFAVSFVLPDDGPFLEAVAERGRLALATSTLSRAAERQPQWLAIDLDGPSLRLALG